MSARADAGDDQRQVDELFTEYLLRVDRGEAIDRLKFLREHEEQAEELWLLMDVDELLRRERFEN